MTSLIGRTLSSVSLLLALFPVQAGLAQQPSQQPFWTPVGPDGGDARSFAPGQTCNATLNAGKPVSILFGAGTWTFNGNPGIDITAPNVILNCPASTILQASSTVLLSGGPYPLIANTVDPANGGMPAMASVAIPIVTNVQGM